MSQPIKISLDEELFLPIYRHLLDSDNNIEFIWGSRDSGKSRHIAQQLILKCLKAEYFLCPLLRKVANTIKDSQWQLIKSVIEEWNLDQFFVFHVSPLEIKCVNGNKFIARGLDEPKNIKSLANPSDAWIEEASDLDENDWILILTSLRSNYGKTQTWCSLNPDFKEDYEDAYIYKTFFKEHYEKGLLNFSSFLEVEYDGEVAKIEYRSTHSTFTDNQYCPPDRAFFYENLKTSSEYDYMVYAKGLFGKRRMGGEFFKAFKIQSHVKSCLYSKDNTIHISLDSNVYPYIAIAAFQIIQSVNGWTVKAINELHAIDPENTASKAGLKIANYLRNKRYTDTVFIYGDRSTKARNNIDDDKRSFYQIVEQNIKSKGYAVRDCMDKHAPTVTSIAGFVNAIFDNEIKGISIEIDNSCKTMISDFINTKEDKDGSMLKNRIKDKNTGISYEPNGHFCDLFKDMIYQAFTKEYGIWMNRFNTPMIGGVEKISRTPKFTL